MHNRYAQMGCSDGQMGHYDPALGAVVYDEQQGGQMGSDISDIVDNFLKQLNPALSSAAVNALRNSDQGKQLEAQTADYLQYMSKEQAAQTLAQKTAEWQAQFSSLINATQAKIQANWKTYLMYTGLAIAAVVVGYYFVLPKLRGVRMATASNPRRRRNAKRRKSSKSRRRN